MLQADGTPGGRSQRAAKDKANAAITGAGKSGRASKKASGQEDAVEEVSLLTALRALFRLLAAEQAQQAHLPLPHSVMMLLVTHLQPQCVPLSPACNQVYQHACFSLSGDRIPPHLSPSSADVVQCDHAIKM